LVYLKKILRISLPDIDTCPPAYPPETPLIIHGVSSSRWICKKNTPKVNLPPTKRQKKKRGKKTVNLGQKDKSLGALKKIYKK
jgi:hypothetical protein